MLELIVTLGSLWFLYHFWSGAFFDPGENDTHTKQTDCHVCEWQIARGQSAWFCSSCGWVSES